MLDKQLNINRENDTIIDVASPELARPGMQASMIAAIAAGSLLFCYTVLVLLGAVGVGGAAADLDEACARAGAAALGCD